MDHLEHAKKLYKKRHDHAAVLSSKDLSSLSASITKMIHTCLVQQGGVASFKYIPFIQVIKRTVGSGKFQAEKAASAFATLEKYLLLLVAQPWKREFWLLKTYGGFFLTKVKAHLDSPEDILELVGYTKEEGSNDDSCLILEHAPDIQVLINVAFDCQVASVECRCIGEYYEKMKCVKLDITDAMNVMLSGIPNDPDVGSPIVSMPGKNVTVCSNHYTNVKPAPSKAVAGELFTPGGMALTPGGIPQRIVASGGMGVGVVSGAGTSSMHRVTGVQARAPPAIATLQPSYPVYDQSSAGLRVDLPNPGNVGMGVAGGKSYSRPPSISSQPAGSRASYGSSTGYVSGTASVLSAPSSAYTVSSGYSSASQASGRYPPSEDRTHPNSSPSFMSPHPSVTSASTGYNSSPFPSTASSPYPATDGMDRVNVNPALLSGTHRHSRQLPTPQQLVNNFPYIDEDEVTVTKTQFPEATHEEHLRESLRNLQNVPPHRSWNKPVMNSSPTATHANQNFAIKEGVPVSYDDWQWFHKGYNTVAGSSGLILDQSGLVQRPAQQTLDVMRPSNDIQPATAVTAMLTQDPRAAHFNPNPMDSRQARARSADYIPLSAIDGTQGVLRPVSDPAVLKASDKAQLPHKLVHDGQNGMMMPGATKAGYCSISSNNVPHRHGATPATSSVATFAQMASMPGKGANGSALLSRQAQNLSPSPSFSSSTAPIAREKGQPEKIVGHNSSNPRQSSSSEVIMRDNPQSKGVVGTGQRSSSHVVTQPTELTGPRTFSRQSSRSLDLSRWKCRYCTVENPTSTSICSVCSRSRDAPDLGAPRVGESKQMCPFCTYENSAGRPDCEMCQKGLPQNVHTYV